MDATTTPYVSVLDGSALADGRFKVVRCQGKQLALFRSGGDVHAIDNRCPHEGYPLSQGDVKDGVLTCRWHNWRFDLATGRCIEGGEDVRSYAAREIDGRVEVDLTDEPAERAVEKRLVSLRGALQKNRIGQAARDSVRLLGLGVAPDVVFAEAARFGSRRAEYGFDHGLAALTDCRRLLHTFPEIEPVLAMAQGVSMVAEPNLRRPERSTPAPDDPARLGADAASAFRSLMEEEEPGQAEALLRGALAQGRSDLSPWLVAAATDHFIGYGHGLIYAVKALQLSEALGDDLAADVLGSVVPVLVEMTREDLLPYMAPFRKALDRLAPRLDRLGTGGARLVDERAYVATLLSAPMADALEATLSHLEAGAAPARIASAIAAAASERLIRFDLGLDRNVEEEIGWLDVTHLLTFSNAARAAVEIHPSPETLRGLFQAAWFVNYVSEADLPEDRRGREIDPVETGDADAALSALEDSVWRRDPGRAMGAVDAYLGTEQPLPRLSSLLARLSLSDPAASFIMAAHVIKTTTAALEEAERLSDPALRRLPLLGLAKFLASPRRERFVTLNAVMAARMVRERGL